MKMMYATVLLGFIATTSAFGPSGAPCYVDEVWDESDVQEFDGIVYGSVS